MNTKTIQRDEMNWLHYEYMSARSLAQRGCEELGVDWGRRRLVRHAVAWMRRHPGGGVRLRAVGCGRRTVFAKGLES